MRLAVAGLIISLIGASAAFAQTVNAPPPAPHVSVPASPISPASVCTPGSTNSGTSCNPAPAPPVLAPLPPPAPIPAPPPSPVPAKPAVALAPGPSIAGAAVGEDKVLSYFKRGTTRVDTRKAFGFVLMPKSAVTEGEKRAQTQFCEIMLASMDFADADEAADTKALVTYWPVVATPSPVAIEAAFVGRDCPRLIAWYDHGLARAIAARADVAGMSGPMLITWPSEGADAQARDPLIVDFASADYARATKALAYWFGQLRKNPALWTSRIREGTIRAELADAINDTAGVVVAVLAGKWESVTEVSAMP